MSYSIIAAIGKNRELGKNGDLCFQLPGDLKYFSKVTRGHKVLMGSKTFRSLPKMLPNREHIVLSAHSTPDQYPEEVRLIKSFNELLEVFPEDLEEEIFVIGGGMVYAEMLKYADRLYLTEVDAEDKSADTFFQPFNKEKYTRKVVGTGKDNGIKYEFVVYSRKESL